MKKTNGAVRPWRYQTLKTIPDNLTSGFPMKMDINLIDDGLSIDFVIKKKLYPIGGM